MPAATKPTTMFSLAVLKDHLKVVGTGSDNELARLGDGISQRVESYCSRLFTTRTGIVETKSGSGNNQLRLRNYPVIQVTAAQYRWTLLDQWVSLNVSTEIELDGVLGIVYLKQLYWPKGPLLTKVTYDAGYGTQDQVDDDKIPPDVYHAALDYAKFSYDRWKSDSLVLGSVTVGGAGSAIIIPDIPKDIKTTLDGHVRYRL